MTPMPDHWTPWGWLPRRPAITAHGPLPDRPDGNFGIGLSAGGAAEPGFHAGMLDQFNMAFMAAGAPQKHVESASHAGTIREHSGGENDSHD